MIVSFLKILLIIPFTVIMSIACIVAMIVKHDNKLFDILLGTFYKGLLVISRVKVVAEGREHIPASVSCIFVANHSSYYDIPSVIIGIGKGRVRMIYKKELERIPVFGWAMRWTNMYIPINRGRGIEAQQTLDGAIQRIKGGDSVLLFAEGTRTTDGKLQPFKRGAFNIAVKAGVPVVPVIINGSYRAMPKGTFRIRPGTVSITVEEPIMPPLENGKSSELELMEMVHQKIEQHYINQ